jgi:hypothetical protein
MNIVRVLENVAKILKAYPQDILTVTSFLYSRSKLYFFNIAGTISEVVMAIMNMIYSLQDILSGNVVKVFLFTEYVEDVLSATITYMKAHLRNILGNISDYINIFNTTSISDAINLIEYMVWKFNINIMDALSATLTRSLFKHAYRTLTETITLVQQFRKAISRILSEVGANKITLYETLLYTLVHIRNISDLLAGTLTFAFFRNIFKTPSGTITDAVTYSIS